MNHTVRYLILWLTTACNLDCRYCYRKEVQSFVMSRDTAEKALSLAASSGMPFHVQLAGGEPTLQPDLVEFVGSTVRAAEWPATIAVQTNATLIDRHFIEICQRFRIEVGVSVDGPPEVQEELRGGAGKTFGGMTLLEEARMPVRVTTVLSSANVGRLYDLAITLARFSNIRGVGFDPLVLSGRAAGVVDLLPSPESVASGTRDFLEAMERINKVYRAQLQWRELEAVRKALSTGSSPHHYCHACTGESLGVHPDGTVYPCGQAIGDPAMKAGTVENVNWDLLGGFFQGKQLSGSCAACLLNGRCPGDCPSRLHYNGASSTAMCIIYGCIAEMLTAEEKVTDSPNNLRRNYIWNR